MSRLLIVVGVAAAGFLVLSGASACGGDDDDDGEADQVADEAEDAIDSDDAITIITTDNEFSTDSLTAPADTEVTLIVDNQGSTLHNWILPEPQVTMELVPAGESGEVSFTLPAGRYEYRCEAHPTEMVGTLTVE